MSQKFPVKRKFTQIKCLTYYIVDSYKGGKRKGKETKFQKTTTIFIFFVVVISDYIGILS